MSVGDDIGSIVPICFRHSITFEWKISDFLSLSDKVGDEYFSDYFSIADEEWYLCLNPNGESDEFRGWISLHLYRAHSGPSKTVNLRFGVKGSSGVEKMKETQYEFSYRHRCYGFKDFLSRSELSDRRSILMPNNQLTIVCDLRSGALNKNDTLPASTDQAVQAVLDGEKMCLKSFLSLLENGDDSDVVIKVRGKEFPVHRNILRARSDVFHSMFAHDVTEKNSGVVKIEDCDPTVFLDFLKHIYSGRCDHISSENVCGLYTASDKYDFADLKQACSDFMRSHIDVGCFCDILALAMKHNDRGLIDCATKFFCSNTVNIIKTTDWQTFLTENPIVGNELFLKTFPRV